MYIYICVCVCAYVCVYKVTPLCIFTQYMCVYSLPIFVLDAYVGYTKCYEKEMNKREYST